VVTAVPSFLLTKVIGKHLEDISHYWLSLLIGGIVMCWSTRSRESEAAVPERPQVASTPGRWKT